MEQVHEQHASHCLQPINNSTTRYPTQLRGHFRHSHRHSQSHDFSSYNKTTLPQRWIKETRPPTPGSLRHLPIVTETLILKRRLDRARRSHHALPGAPRRSIVFDRLVGPPDPLPRFRGFPVHFGLVDADVGVAFDNLFDSPPFLLATDRVGLVGQYVVTKVS